MLQMFCLIYDWHTLGVELVWRDVLYKSKFYHLFKDTLHFCVAMPTKQLRQIDMHANLWKNGYDNCAINGWIQRMPTVNLKASSFLWKERNVWSRVEVPIVLQWLIFVGSETILTLLLLKSIQKCIRTELCCYGVRSNQHHLGEQSGLRLELMLELNLKSLVIK